MSARPAIHQHRAKRCAHGFYRGLCAVRDCAHWDGVIADDQARTIVHESWGRHNRRVKYGTREG